MVEKNFFFHLQRIMFTHGFDIVMAGMPWLYKPNNVAEPLDTWSNGVYRCRCVRSIFVEVVKFNAGSRKAILNYVDTLSRAFNRSIVCTILAYFFNVITCVIGLAMHGRGRCTLSATVFQITVKIEATRLEDFVRSIAQQQSVHCVVLDRASVYK